MGLLGDLRGGGLAGADRPDRLVGQGEAARPGGQTPRSQLPVEDRESLARPGARRGVSPTQTRGTRPARTAAAALRPTSSSALAVVAPALAVAAEHPGAAGVGELRAGDVAGVGALLLGVEILAADGDAGCPSSASDDRREQREARGRPPPPPPARTAARRASDAAVADRLAGAGGASSSWRRPAAGVSVDRSCLPAPRRRAASCPARNSSEAPPPVETWPIRSSTPAWRAAATVSPPPITVKPGQLGERRGHLARAGIEGRLLEDAQRPVPEQRPRAAACACGERPGGSPDRRRAPSCRRESDRRRRSRSARARRDRPPPPGRWAGTLRCRGSRRARGCPRASSTASASTSEPARSQPLRREEGVRHAAADEQHVEPRQEVLQGVDLALDLGAAEQGGERLLGLAEQACPALRPRAPGGGRRPCAARRDGTPTIEAWARWARRRRRRRRPRRARRARRRTPDRSPPRRRGSAGSRADRRRPGRAPRQPTRAGSPTQSVGEARLRRPRSSASLAATGRRRVLGIGLALRAGRSGRRAAARAPALLQLADRRQRLFDPRGVGHLGRRSTAAR